MMPGSVEALPALKLSTGLLPPRGWVMVSVANLPFPGHWQLDGRPIGVPALTGISSAALTSACVISVQASVSANAVRDKRTMPVIATANTITRMVALLAVGEHPI